MPPSPERVPLRETVLARADGADVCAARRSLEFQRRRRYRQFHLSTADGWLSIFMQPDSSQLVDQSSADPNFPAPLLSKFETSLA
jgi:hypothetical protein